MDALSRTAYHEAAHAVADHVHESIVDVVTIEPDAGLLGACLAEDSWHDEDSLRQLLVSLLAGMAAELRLAPDDEARIREGARFDIERAEALVGFGGWSMTEALGWARAFVANHWSAIERVAQELLRVETIDGFELEYLVEDDRDGLASYRQLRGRIAP